MQFIWIFILILTTTSINLVTGQSWTWSPPSIQTVDIYNESAINISWEYSYETEPSFVQLSVILYKLNTTDIFRNNFAMDGKDRFNFTSLMIVNNNFLKANAYYAIILEYNTTYNYGVNQSQKLWGRSFFELIKMATTPIPSERRFVDIKSNSAIISMMWPREIPYFTLEMNANLNGKNTTLPIETVSNETYLINKYRFENLSPDTNYRLVTIFTRRYLSNDIWAESVENTETITTLKESSSDILDVCNNFMVHATDEFGVELANEGFDIIVFCVNIDKIGQSVATTLVGQSYFHVYEKIKEINGID
ncbi:unnamed protein product [Adineta steineri]|uniref:Fibronectin type-III domain-containing protein n=1 Tax=Adineta steineri TaxID=433720 RepID=A0A819NKX7_9BILA|nr:unnamed protein product [Adineta steineri]CAF3998589.1 unnamed protein product [Adineta steineri]